MSKVGHWLNNSVVSSKSRGPGFDSRSDHEFFFFPCDNNQNSSRVHNDRNGAGL